MAKGKAKVKRKAKTSRQTSASSAASKRRTSTSNKRTQRRRAVGPAQVRAAGGIVVKTTKKGPKVLLVHRPNYDDWSFPKGKLDDGETFKEAALREVEEETGFVCTPLKPRLPELRYTDNRGRTKEVRYWLMVAESGEFVANDEVDRIAWLRWNKVTDRLSYGKDRRLFERLIASGELDRFVL